MNLSSNVLDPLVPLAFGDDDGDRQGAGAVTEDEIKVYGTRPASVTARTRICYGNGAAPEDESRASPTTRTSTRESEREREKSERARERRRERERESRT